MRSDNAKGSRSGSFGALLILSLPLLASCAEYQAYDNSVSVRERFLATVPIELHDRLDVPFEIDDSIREAIEFRVPASGGEARRRDSVLDFIFGYLDLQYSLSPTLNAEQAFAARQGNCLTFVNLFVGIARERRLNPFYVEVRDYQRWNYQQGVVVSRGHIVAGMRVDGNLATYDFLPYQAKSYRDFEPISDLQAVAHYYNNLGAEALMAGRSQEAYDYLRIATSLAPDFDKALNNSGVALLRLGRSDAAIEVFERGLEFYPDDPPLLTNAARAYQQVGNEERAEPLLAKLEGLNQTNPFFYVYRGDMALSEGDLTTALDYMRKALRTDSELPEVHVGLAKVYLALGKLSEARHHVERALKLDATHEEARKYAGLIRRQESP